MALVPERLSNFNVYIGKTSQLHIGLSDIEMPRFEAMTETLSGAGMAGEIESVVPGHFKSMVAKLKYLTPTPEAIALLAPGNQDVVLRGALQVTDSTTNQIVVRPMRVEISGPVKAASLGKMEPGKRMDSDVDFEIVAIRIFIDDIAVVELDKLNMIFKVNGFDYLRSTRIAMGGI